MKNRLVIYLDMTPNAPRPYRIAEVFMCLDGYRTRVSSECFRTLDEAQKFVDQYKAERAATNGN